MNKSKLLIVLEGEPRAANVYGKNRVTVPFIGIRQYSDGSLTRGVGAKCPTQEKLIFQPIDSPDVLHFWRAFMMISEISEVTDSLVADSITATKSERRLENLAQTTIYQTGGSYRVSQFFAAQRHALSCRPCANDINDIIRGFAAHNAPLVCAVPATPQTVEVREKPLYLPLAHALKAAASA